MKTDSTQLAKIYNDHLIEKKAEPGAGCPEPERLVQCVMAEGSRKDRKEVLGHVAECADCARLLKCMLDVSGEIDRIAVRAKAFSGHPRSLEPREKRPVCARAPGKPAVVALVSLFGIAVITFSIIKLSERSAIRGGQDTQIQLVFPGAADSISIGDIRFEWEILPGAKFYAVELFDQTLELLWRSDPIKGSQAQLPETTGHRIVRGEPFFWRVTAVLENDIEVRSKLGEFLITK